MRSENYHFHLINNLFSVKFCRTFEITSYISVTRPGPDHSKSVPGFFYFLFDVLFHKIKSYLSLMEPEFYTFSILNTSGFI